MKTIEEAAKENAIKTEPILYQGKAEKAFKAGIEFAQRWIPVEEELPEEENGFYKPVLVLNDNYSLVSSAAYKNGMFIPDNPVLSHSEITHWRPIELK